MQAEFAATIEGLSRATAFVERTLDEAECPLRAKTKLMVALDEVASNIVHYSGARTFTVDIDFPENPSAVRIAFADEGKPFNPLEVGDPDVTSSAADRAVGGLGMFMVRQMMDNVSYAHEGNCNVLTISKLREG